MSEQSRSCSGLTGVEFHVFFSTDLLFSNIENIFMIKTGEVKEAFFSNYGIY